MRIAIVLDNFSPHLSTKKDRRVGDWAADNNVELAYVPFYASVERGAFDTNHLGAWAGRRLGGRVIGCVRRTYVLHFGAKATPRSASPDRLTYDAAN